MERASYFGNPWVGMFVKTTDTISLVPVDSMDKLNSKVESALKTNIIRFSVADSNLLGVYLAMNKNGIVVPNITTPKEVEMLKSSGLNVVVSSEKNNAHGNNIAVNDKIGIINPHVSTDSIKEMEDALGVELVPTSIAGYSAVGSTCLLTNNGFLVHYKATEEDLDNLKQILKLPGNKGTVNMGAGFVSYGVIVNSHGYVAGEATTAFELGRVEEALGLIR